MGTRRAAKSYFTLQYRHDKEGGGGGVIFGRCGRAEKLRDTFSLSLSALPPLARYYSDSKKH